MKGCSSLKKRDTNSSCAWRRQLFCPCASKLPRTYHYPKFTSCLVLLGSLSLLGFASSPAQAQGVLTVTPGRSIVTNAGTGTVGFSGDGGAATSAEFARPSGVAYDRNGNLFVADANNHVVREVTAAGVITTVAGTGTAGFGGDGGAATAAFLDTPTSVAVDGNGNLYIADSHNHRIREVSQGSISTVAGTGVAGFSGDGGTSTSAQLALPSGVALDTSGKLYIADTNNHRIRKVSAGIITTVAGNGEELFAGDGGPAIAASLDQPTAIAADASGNLYIADKNNQRVRIVTSSGTISTFAGNGTGAFSGSFGGDGSAATSASLAKPVSVSVDSAGNIYVADTNNQRIRQISANGTIATVAGTGDQGFAGDSGPAAAAILNSPRALAADSTGNLTVADTRNQRLRAASLGKLVFASQAVGTASAPQALTFGNTGTAPLTISSLSLSGPFAATPGASCPAPPIVLNPGASCTQNVAFQPTSAGQLTGSINVAGQGVTTQTVLLAGTAGGGTTTLLLASNKPVVLSGESVTFTASLNTLGGAATGAVGTVTFYAGSTNLGSGTVTQGNATLTTSVLPDGVQTVTAVYSGNAGYGGSTSNPLSENVADLNLALTALQTPTVEPGHTAAVPLSLTETGAAGLTGSVTFTATNVPAGLSAAFTPATTALGSGQQPFTMTVTAAPTAPPATTSSALSLGGSGTLFAVLFIPVLRKRSVRRIARLRLLPLLLLSIGGLFGVAGLTGCGSNTGFFSQKPQTYSITVTATATDATGGTLTRNTNVAIIVQ